MPENRRMKTIQWSQEKNRQLQAERGLKFPRNSFLRLSSLLEKQLRNISKIKIIMTKLTPEEKDILESYNNDEWVSVATPARMAELKSYAKETLTQDKKITLLLSSLDLEALQAKAIEEGIPYQTLISSILHKYVTGRLVESSS